MAAHTRSAPAAFGRGVSQVVANPGLLLAPLAFGGAMFATVAAAVLAAVFSFGRAFASRAAAFGRGPAAFLDFLESLQGLLFASPGALLLALLSILVAILLLTALAAWVRAGVTGSLAEIDARAAEDATVPAFRHPALGASFFSSASRLFGPFFALVNLYALVASFVFLLIAAPLAGAFAAMAAGRTGLLIVCGVLFAVLVLVTTVASAALRVVYLAAGRVLATERVDCLGAVARAMALVRECPGRAATLYLLTVAGAMTVGLAFVVPRLVATFAAGAVHSGFGVIVCISAFFILLQVAATLAYDLAVTGSFVALWPQEAAAEAAGPAVRSA